MGNFVTVALDVIVKVVNTVLPIGQGYRTVIFLGIGAVLAVLDVLKIGPGNLFSIAAPILGPLTIGSALAHQPTPKP